MSINKDSLRARLAALNMATWQECFIITGDKNDKTVEETKSSLSFQETICMQHGAVASPYVSQNASVSDS